MPGRVLRYYGPCGRVSPRVILRCERAFFAGASLEGSRGG
jgi:hypothetical protein